MAATADQIAEVRRMVNEPTTATYSDNIVSAQIEKYPLLDVRGIQWYKWDNSTTPPTQDDNENWIPTYDLNAAAADIWGWKAAALAPNSDFTSVNQTFHDSQPYKHAMSQVRYYRARRRPATATAHASVGVYDSTPAVINLPEPD